MQPKVFIILLNWNNWPDTLDCLRQLKNNDYPNYKVVIVDNDSAEKSEIQNPDVKIIYNNKNLGFTGGNNVGVKYALKHGADYVLLLNSDVYLDSVFLTKLIEVGQSNKKIGFLGPKIYFADNRKKLWCAGGRVNWLFNKGTMRGCGEIDKGQYDNPAVQKTEYVTGCCLLAKREVLEKIGLMREDYFLYYEDTDWSLRASQAGYICAFVPSAKIWHIGSKTTGLESPPYIYYMVRNGLILSHYFAPWYIKPFVFGDVLWRIKKQNIKFIFMPKKRKWVKYILLGIKDYYLKKWGKNENWY